MSAAAEPASLPGAARPVVAEVELAVSGMTCASCASRVERKLRETGAVAVTVNVATGRAVVSAPEPVEAARLVEAVEQAGYSAQVLPPPGTRPDEDAAGSAEAARLADLRRRLVVALVLFVPAGDVSVRPGRAAGDFHQGLPGAGGVPQRGHCAAG